MDEYSLKLDKFLMPLISNISNPIILELGVENGRSTKKFLQICKKNNGKLFSVDTQDCSKILDDPNWNFFKTRDDNFEFVKSKLSDKIDVLYVDSLHEAEHVKNLIYGYYPILKKEGYIFIDDISHLPYLQNKPRNNFYCEINNKETFDILLSIYSKNIENFELNFSFMSSGLAIIKKLNNNNLSTFENLNERSWKFKNILRKLWRKIKKD
tara:strand:- start:1169 stop:1801 length:633 start_codon:yes stop_codon:yes gene_type:complete